MLGNKSETQWTKEDATEKSSADNDYVLNFSLLKDEKHEGSGTCLAVLVGSFFYYSIFIS